MQKTPSEKHMQGTPPASEASGPQKTEFSYFRPEIPTFSLTFLPFFTHSYFPTFFSKISLDTLLVLNLLLLKVFGRAKGKIKKNSRKFI